ncbi:MULTISPECIES: electron transport complex subunit E [unclassified Wenzhouxiangella]|uniref:electron transport complex subunit E n=1 Tax=unclassified Wenzhouxiangella TaxID=2613841 RepID=UPI000E32A0B7|nr:MULTISPECIES: electron transport complex subunit E [unclassified Wenzhouxiangella]RFF28939.1 electron transport complex subunit E [Wenzhouxiangella sp. 15181]RFP68352.1 electron transport complex subunit E [Wenzhouxiangella sp. 15190]
MTKTESKRIWRNGLWDNNPGLVQLLGLCPLLAVSNTAVNGLGLGLATLLVLLVSNGLVSVLRSTWRPELRIPAFVLIIASTVTAIDLSMQAWLHELSRTLGIFVPLIVTNCTILARAEAFASKQPVGASLIDALAQGTGFAAVLIVLGAGREIVGQGTLLAGADMLFGGAASAWTIQLLPFDQGLLLAVLPPGAFIGLGLLVALRQYLVNRPRRAAVESRTSPSPAQPTTP